MNNNIEQLFQQAVYHRNTHDCSAYPYEDGKKLVDYINRYNPTEILEIGTGMGYTATIIALAAPTAHIDTIEKDGEHARVAQEFLQQNNVADRVTVINHPAEAYLQTIQKQYDFIFFDGYQIHYEFLPHYERLLKPGGILFLGNNHLKSRTSVQFFDEFNSNSHWNTLETFAETTVAQHL